MITNTPLLKKKYRHNLVIVTAPSGAGKSTIISSFLKKHPDFCFSVSHTTRQLRPKEKDGKDYYFLSESEFKKKVKQNEFIEWAKVYNHYYGTSFKEIDRVGQKKKIILDVDVQGSLQLQNQFEALYIFISVPDIATLKKRLIKRGTEDKSSLNARLEMASKELSLKNHWKNIVVNDDINKAYSEFENIIKNFFSN